MYLTENIDGVPMAGVINAACFKTDRLQRFGYVTLTAQEDNIFCEAGGSIRAHEFHYYDSSSNGEAFEAKKPLSDRSWRCCHVSERSVAGFPHFYYYSNPDFIFSFLMRCVYEG